MKFWQTSLLSWTHDTFAELIKRSAHATLPTRLAQRVNSELVGLLVWIESWFSELKAGRLDQSKAIQDIEKEEDEFLEHNTALDKKYRDSVEKIILQSKYHSDFALYLRRMLFKILGASEVNLYLVTLQWMPRENPSEYSSRIEDYLTYEYLRVFSTSITTKLENISDAQAKDSLPHKDSISHNDALVTREVTYDSDPVSIPEGSVPVIPVNRETMRRDVNSRNDLLSLSQTVLIKLLRWDNYLVIEQQGYFQNPKVLLEVVSFLEDYWVSIWTDWLLYDSSVWDDRLKDANLDSWVQTYARLKKKGNNKRRNSIDRFDSVKGDIISDYRDKNRKWDDILQEYKISSGVLYRMLIDNNIPLRWPQGRNFNSTKTLNNQVIWAYRDPKLTGQQIADMYGIPLTRVNSIIHTARKNWEEIPFR